jgi:hypothetical protein
MPKHVTIALVSALVVLGSQAAFASPVPNNRNPNQPTINGVPTKNILPDGTIDTTPPCMRQDDQFPVATQQAQPFNLNLLNCI